MIVPVDKIEKPLRGFSRVLGGLVHPQRGQQGAESAAPQPPGISQQWRDYIGTSWADRATQLRAQEQEELAARKRTSEQQYLLGEQAYSLEEQRIAEAKKRSADRDKLDEAVRSYETALPENKAAALEKVHILESIAYGKQFEPRSSGLTAEWKTALTAQGIDVEAPESTWNPAQVKAAREDLKTRTGLPLQRFQLQEAEFAFRQAQSAEARRRRNEKNAGAMSAVYADAISRAWKDYSSLPSVPSGGKADVPGVDLTTPAPLDTRTSIFGYKLGDAPMPGNVDVTTAERRKQNYFFRKRYDEIRRQYPLELLEDFPAGPQGDQDAKDELERRLSFFKALKSGAELEPTAQPGNVYEPGQDAEGNPFLRADRLRRDLHRRVQ